MRSSESRQNLGRRLARHDHHAVHIGHDHVAGIHERAGADHRDVDRPGRRLHRALRVIALAHTGKSISVRSSTSRTPASMTRPTRRARAETASRSPNIPSVLTGRGGHDQDVARWHSSTATCIIQLSPGWQQHGDRGCPAPARRRIDRPHVGLHQARAALRLVHGGDAQLAERLDHVGVGALDVAVRWSASCLGASLGRSADTPARVALEDLGACRRGGRPRRVDVALGVVVVVAGLGIDAAHRADHLRGEQDVLDRDHLEQQVDARLVVDAGVEEDVVQQMLVSGGRFMSCARPR